MKRKTKRDIILICPGGAMSGVFGVGVLTAFQEANLYPRIKRIYAGSAGAINTAYFLSKQLRLGSSVYYDDLVGRAFIRPEHVPIAYWQKLINRYVKNIPKKNLLNPVDLDYLFEIIKNKKKLDIKKLLKSKIDFRVVVTDLKTLKLKTFDGRTKNILNLLKASACLVPYYNSPIKIYNRNYIDGMIVDPLYLSEVFKEINPVRKPVTSNGVNKNYKIIIINNSAVQRNFLFDIKGFLEASAAYFMFKKDAIYKAFMERNKKFQEGLELIKKHKNIFLIASPRDKTIASTTNRKKLLETYNSGIRIGKNFLKKNKFI